MATWRAAFSRHKHATALPHKGRTVTVHCWCCRQESYFHYLFGVTEDSYYGAIDLRSGDAYLFMPRLPDSFAVWFGEMPTPSSVKAKYAVQVSTVKQTDIWTVYIAPDVCRHCRSVK